LSLGSLFHICGAWAEYMPLTRFHDMRDHITKFMLAWIQYIMIEACFRLIRYNQFLLRGVCKHWVDVGNLLRFFSQHELVIACPTAWSHEIEFKYGFRWHCHVISPRDHKAEHVDCSSTWNLWLPV
jgi:hypothetical protein